MSKRCHRSWLLSFIAVGLAPLWLASCAPTGSDNTGTAGATGSAGSGGSGNTTGSGGTTGIAGTTGNGGTNTGAGGNTTGAGGTNTGAGGDSTGAGGSTTGGGRTITGSGGDGAGGSGGSATGEGGRGGITGGGGNGPGNGGRGGGTAGTGAGGTGPGGRGGATAGTGGGTAGTMGTGGAGGEACPAGTTAEFGCGKPRTMGFMGCSMSVNVATGYQRRMGMRMWAPISAYGGQVVQSWTPASGGVWSSFDNAANTNGKPTDIWMQICIFAQQGVTAAEVQKMITNARAHSTPTTRIWISGQPTYSQGHTCSLAGTGGAELTDMRAKEAHNPANNVFYAGTFLLKANVSPSEVSSDTCHASSAGELALGDQFIAKFGK